MRAWRGDTGRARIPSANASRDKTQGVITTTGSPRLVSSATCGVADWRKTQPRTSLNHTDKPSTVIEPQLWSSELRMIRAGWRPHLERLFVSSALRPSCQTFPRWRTNLQNSYRHAASWRSEEHTSELQSLAYLVCRLLLEKKKK